MKSTILLFLFPLFSIDVYGADVKEPVSVMVGDSVTLHTYTNIQAADVTVWNFGQKSIAMIDEGSVTITASDKELGARLQLDSQTGDLKIINIKTKDSGDYKLDINRASRTEESVSMIFHVSVVSADEVKSLSVMEGDSITLQTGLTEIQRDAVIRWRFGQQKSLVAEINRKAGIFKTFDGPDERFRDRLHLNNQTGSLNITNITITDSGLYEVEISSTSSKHTIHKTFTVTVSDDVESVSVMKGDSVTLLTGLTEIQTDDKIVWKFEDDEIIADLNDPVNKRWSNNGQNNKIGDLNISNIQKNQSGLYKVEIITRRMILHKKYNITMIDAVKSVSVKKGETVTLPITEIQKDDLILWMFGEIVLAEILKAAQRFYISDVPDKSFRNRLQLDHQTGSLIITDTRTTDPEEYYLKISSSRHIINRRIIVTVGPGLSPGAIAGIGGGVLLLAAVVVGGVIYYRRYRNVNGQNPTSNGTQNPGDPADEGTELTNAS